MTAEKRLLKDIEISYELTLSDIKRYIRQTGSISIDVVKKFIRWNYFRNEDAVDLYEHQDDYETIITMDMFDLQLWILENYDIDSDKLDDIEDELNYLTTFHITSSQSERSVTE